MPKKLDLTDNLEKYIIDHSEKLSNVQNEIIQHNISLGDQQKLQISISQAQFLQTLIKVSNVKKILEIGSFTGFSALSMAMALPVDGILISLDKNPEFSKKAKYFYDKANEKRIKQIIKPALESLKELKITKKLFDLIFIDADKENYLNYYESCIDLIDKKGLIVIDNVLWHGEVAEDTNNDKFTNIIRDFNNHVKKDKRITKNIIPIGDGLTICIKIMFTISGFYKFKKINFLKKYKTYLENEISNTSIKGSIIISSEGINGSIAGNSKDIFRILKFLKKEFKFKEFDSSNISTSRFQPFHKAKVKVKKEVVPLGLKITSESKRHNRYLSGKSWNKLIKKRNSRD